MGRRNQDDLISEDELTAAFLSDDQVAEEYVSVPEAPIAPEPVAEEDWEEEDSLPGQLALDIYETREKLIVKARTAGINRSELDVSIADNTLTIRGTLNAGNEGDVIHYHMQECYWGEFSRTVHLPVPVKEEGIEATLKDGVLTVYFVKVKQDTFKKIQIT